MYPLATILITASILFLVGSSTLAEEKQAPANALDFTMKDIDGKEVKLSEKYAGKVVLIVNVASKCGLTPQYKGLQALHEKYAEKGLAILGFPCNQFGGQEPGDEGQIKGFCDKSYGVKFDLFSKIDVNGEKAAPLYKHLKDATADKGDVKWNFEKFLIGRDGKVVKRYHPKTTPEEIAKDIEAQLAVETK